MHDSTGDLKVGDTSTRYLLAVVNPPDHIWKLIGDAVSNYMIPPGTELRRVSDIGLFQVVLEESNEELHGIVIDIRSPAIHSIPAVPILYWGPKGQLTAAVPGRSRVVRSDLPDDLKMRLTSKEDVNRALNRLGMSQFEAFFTHLTGTPVLDEKGFGVGQMAEAICWLLSWVSVSQADAPTEGRIDVRVSAVWDEIMKAIVANPALLHQMNSRKFEELIAEMFASFGFEVELTARTRDGGYDIIALRKLGLTETRHLIEAKCYSPPYKVPPAKIRALIGTRQIRKASQVILATSSYVSSNAKKEFRAHMPHELDLIERDKILEWCRNYPEIVCISGRWSRDDR